MRFGDLLSLPLVALWQQKSRSLLTTLGVVFGSFVLAASLSIGQGVQDTIDGISRRSDLLRKIAVSTQWRPPASKVKDVQVSGNMSDTKRARIRQAIADHQARFGTQNSRVPLSREKLAELAGLDHVEAAVPVLYNTGHVVLGDRAEHASIVSARPRDAKLQRRLVAGRMFRAESEQALIVSEFLLYRLGLTDDADVAGAVGTMLRLELRTEWNNPGIAAYLVKPGGGETTREERNALDKISQKLPGLLDQFDLSAAEIELLDKSLKQAPPPKFVFAVELPIVGVVRMPTDDDQTQLWDPLAVSGDCMVPYETVMDLADRAFGAKKWDIAQVVVFVDDEQHTRDVYDRIKESGLNAFAPLEQVDRERLTYLLIFSAMTCVAAVALLVSALGIANTMLMSVLERTREIGIMKAVGAGHWQLQLVFLIEGALIGVVGGSLGLLLAWGTSYPADAWVHSMVAGNFPVELEDSLFVFPPWLAATVLLFAVVVTTLAAVYPARRAARIDPVAALRHE